MKGSLFKALRAGRFCSDFMKQSRFFVSLFCLFSALALSVGSARAEEVYLIRGGFDIFSLGMNDMAKALQAKGVKASSHSILAWKGIADDIIKRSKVKKGVSYPIIFLGHSLGADAAPEFANYLGENGVIVDLVIGFDATGRRVFNKGAKKVINYRSSAMGPYVKGPGFRGTITEVDVSKFGANHFTVEKVKGVQDLALAAVMSQLRRRR
jgi:hypothetical protein